MGKVPCWAAHATGHGARMSAHALGNEGHEMNSAPPAGYTTIAPWIVTPDTGELLAFITAAFDGEELARVSLEDGSIGHAEIRVGDTIVLAFDKRPGWPETP